MLVDRVTHTDEMIAQVDDVLIGKGLVATGEKVVVISGMPPGTSGSTNDLRIHRVGDVHAEAVPAYHGLRRIQVPHPSASQACAQPSTTASARSGSPTSSPMGVASSSVGRRRVKPDPATVVGISAADEVNGR